MFSWLIVDVCCCDETECLSELYLNYTNYITTLNYTELNITTKLYTSTMTYIHTICNTILISTRILHSKSTLPHYIIIYIYIIEEGFELWLYIVDDHCFCDEGVCCVSW